MRYTPHPIVTFIQAKNTSIRHIIEMVKDAAKIAFLPKPTERERAIDLKESSFIHFVLILKKIFLTK